MNHLDNNNDKILLRQIAAGDSFAFKELYDQYRRKVYYIAWRLSQSEDEAEDVVQEIFTKLWIGRDKLPEIDYFNAYLNTLIRNHVFNCLRKKANEEVFILSEVKKTDTCSEDITKSIELKELQTQLHNAIKALPPQQRRVFQLGRIDGCKHDEIAREMNISKETVKKHMMAALNNLKLTLEKHGRISALLLVMVGVQ